MSTTHGESLLEFLLEMRHTSDFSNLACACAVLLSEGSPFASLDEYRAFLIAFSIYTGFVKRHCMVLIFH